MAIDSTPPLNINIQIRNVSDNNSPEVSASTATSTADVQAPKNLAGRTVTLVRDVSKWAADETKAIGQSIVKETIKDIKSIRAGAAFVAKKFTEGIRSLHEKFQLYRADKKANKEWKLSEARAEQRHAESPGSKAAFRLQPQRPEPAVSSQARKLDQETRDIQLRLNLLKLPDVPDHDPNV